MKIIIALFISSVLICLSQCSKILLIYPVPGPSHFMLGSALAKGLAEAGHDTTIIAPFSSDKNLPKNGTYREIVLENLADEFKKMNEKSGSMFQRGNINVLLMLPFLIKRSISFSEKIFQEPQVQKLLNSDETFDVVIVEHFMNPVLVQLAARFKAPLIIYSPIGSNTWINHYVGNPSNPAAITNAFLPSSTNMSFFERLYNTFLSLTEILLFNFQAFPKNKALAKKYFPNEPDLEETLFNPSLVLLNSHVSTSRPTPLVPNMIEIGGYHIEKPKELPADLKKFLDEAPNGVVYFSMGSTLKSAEIPEDKRKILLGALSKLKQKVLWKFESEDDIELPPNVITRKWLPQNDILAHKNVKLFITHGGMLSTTETIYHGVPVLAIPVFGDQQANSDIAVSNGFGLAIPYRELTEENLSQSLNELLNNPKYRENAQQRAKMFHDRIATPMETAIYWVEYVIRNPNAKQYLKVGGVNLAWYQYLLLDVVAFVGGIILISCYIFVKIVKILCCKKAKSKKQDKIKKS